MVKTLLFSEPSIAETCVWCDINPEIDPAKWACICRVIAKLDITQFDMLYSRLGAKGRYGPLSVQKAIPLVSIGPGGIGGNCQKEYI